MNVAYAMNSKQIRRHGMESVDMALNNIQTIVQELRARGASDTSCNTMDNAVATCRNNPDDIEMQAITIVVGRGLAWPKLHDGVLHPDLITYTDLFADLDYHINIIRHKLVPHKVIPVMCTPRIDGAKLGECPVCGRVINNLHHLENCGFCGTMVTWTV